MHKSYDEYKKILELRLNPKRYYHSLCVADEAYRLAQKYGADTKKAYLCGLLHDITKNVDEKEHRMIFEKYSIKLNEIENSAEKLWHSISGSAYVKFVLEIDDEEIFDAIRYHTTAKANMPLLSKILYLADFTSKDRDYDDVEVMRKLVDISLDDAYKYALSYTVKDLAEKNCAIHLDTLNAYNEIMLKEK
ncbi:MAG: bis(5'-nucleosyl)-tetraphosphatase (symmetrical) YqeK [Clostridia bacterium]|nr:bis(5'-nucleosyl)-tetraphosphatase (symmetrical) YqeK [Clostridia bacterium]